ncbi:pyrophosphatase PpaX [Pullulanibacillus camelliae]|uniref:Pyrophosphatase PpaX n=1 Tax=Pullulanibacillus camelliae TaxID=1707096 RepID=A0A8J2VNX3_9BACL|nr:pyrophosphatase PpaX [Pullulanibacillus camelliae]GGE36510.1 pyrophosphatase PpaX [Pullulanibacillus camelliae]
MINTLLFDLDGTLINTNELIIASFLHTLEHYYPNKYTRADIIDFIGEPLEISFSKVDSERVEDMVKRYREYNVRMHDQLVTEFPNVYTTIEALHRDGYKLAIVTSKRWKTVKMGLKLSRLDAFFDVVVAIDDIEKPKPDAEPVLRALKALHAKPSEAVMVGDSVSDIEAGKNAETKTAGVAWSLKGVELLKQAQPDFILEDIRDILTICK